MLFRHNEGLFDRHRRRLILKFGDEVWVFLLIYGLLKFWNFVLSISFESSFQLSMFARIYSIALVVKHYVLMRNSFNILQGSNRLQKVWLAMTIKSAEERFGGKIILDVICLSDEKTIRLLQGFAWVIIVREVSLTVKFENYVVRQLLVIWENLWELLNIFESLLVHLGAKHNVSFVSIRLQAEIWGLNFGFTLIQTFFEAFDHITPKFLWDDIWERSILRMQLCSNLDNLLFLSHFWRSLLSYRLLSYWKMMWVSILFVNWVDSLINLSFGGCRLDVAFKGKTTLKTFECFKFCFETLV